MIQKLRKKEFFIAQKIIFYKLTLKTYIVQIMQIEKCHKSSTKRAVFFVKKELKK